ncbi:MAG TPA: hypothetical protein PK719_08880 [Bacteroidales bacterium]|jgi:hypothetical protein|nr:hypothetical protein [Bacteroidales bacterium]OQB63054.1 MAG: hypothetical protein BWX96_01269 [Bacteroidetes bacterium ADurb.Bin145]NMD01678.1 hypothetical protein [Bacteroidales bacterium]HOU01490.1 hypothetical protein [Bacteroidales bacterium]HQG63760.1 hypothetical protein [Bacteroidales bacterium]
MKGKFFLVFIIVTCFCTSCRNSSNKTTEFIFPEADSVPLGESEKLSTEAIEEISKNISSPVEIANLLQMMSVPFSPDYLASSIDPNKQITAFDKALTLGILGADLGYLNMYERTGSSIDILSSIRKLAEGIKVGQFFDFETIKRLSLNKSNLDSLLFLSIDSYTQIDKYLRDNARGQLSSLMIIGVWIEGQYLATQVVKNYPDPVLKDRIGEQKIILNDLILLANPYCSKDAEYARLCGYLQQVKEKYRDVRISYTLGEPVSVEKDGGLVITQTETSKVEMTEEQLADIIQITKEIRDKLITKN